MITLAVDAMGGDVGLDVTAPAAAAFLNRQPDARLLMVGYQEQVQAAIRVQTPNRQIPAAPIYRFY